MTLLVCGWRLSNALLAGDMRVYARMCMPACVCVVCTYGFFYILDDFASGRLAIELCASGR